MYRRKNIEKTMKEWMKFSQLAKMRLNAAQNRREIKKKESIN